MVLQYYHLCRGPGACGFNLSSALGPRAAEHKKRFFNEPPLRAEWQEMCAFKCAEGLSLNYLHAGNEPRARQEKPSLDVHIITGGRHKQMRLRTMRRTPPTFHVRVEALQLVEALLRSASPSLAGDEFKIKFRQDMTLPARLIYCYFMSAKHVFLLQLWAAKFISLAGISQRP